ncbi:MAG: hypothetical protein RLZZ299_1678 [Pseudomonadota bacterium]|jgi:predicted alpha/beta hydrolase
MHTYAPGPANLARRVKGGSARLRAGDWHDTATRLAWRLVHARSREPFLSPVAPADLPRLHYTAEDGWTAPVPYLPAPPGTRGEPVVLAHALGGTWRDFALEPVGALACRLRDAGHAVYLLTHRGDREARAPADAQPFDLDDIATRDVPAALDAIAAHSGFPRMAFVGHALGGQAAYLALALGAGRRIAALATICSPVRFTPPASATRHARLVATLLPRRWILPAHAVTRLMLPFAAPTRLMDAPRTEGPVARARLRYASGDLHAGVLRQLSRAVAEGHLCDRTGTIDVCAALRPLPSLVMAAAEDTRCTPEQAWPAAERTGAETALVPGGHLDPLTARSVREEVVLRLLAFLEPHRGACEAPSAG